MTPRANRCQRFRRVKAIEPASEQKTPTTKAPDHSVSEFTNSAIDVNLNSDGTKDDGRQDSYRRSHKTVSSASLKVSIDHSSLADFSLPKRADGQGELACRQAKDLHSDCFFDFAGFRHDFSTFPPTTPQLRLPALRVRMRCLGGHSMGLFKRRHLRRPPKTSHPGQHPRQVFAPSAVYE